jgi:hypothetical protein
MKRKRLILKIKKLKLNAKLRKKVFLSLARNPQRLR